MQSSSSIPSLPRPHPALPSSPAADDGWLLPKLDGSSVIVRPLAAEEGRVTLHLHFDEQAEIPERLGARRDIVIKWTRRRDPSELDASRTLQSPSFVRLLGGRKVTDATLDQVIPGLSEVQYKSLRTAINARGNHDNGGNVVRADLTLTNSSGKQDILIQEYLPRGNFTPSKAACSTSLWNQRREAMNQSISGGLEEMAKHGLVHHDPRAANILVEEKGGKLRFVIGDLGSVQEKEDVDPKEEAGLFLRSAARVRDRAVKRKRAGAYPSSDYVVGYRARKSRRRGGSDD